MGGRIEIQAQGQRLDKYGADVFDATGRATVELGPVPPGQVWRVTRMTISASSADPMPACPGYLAQAPRVLQGCIDPQLVQLHAPRITGAQRMVREL